MYAPPAAFYAPRKLAANTLPSPLPLPRFTWRVPLAAAPFASSRHGESSLLRHRHHRHRHQRFVFLVWFVLGCGAVDCCCCGHVKAARRERETPTETSLLTPVETKSGPDGTVARRDVVSKHSRSGFGSKAELVSPWGRTREAQLATSAEFSAPER